MRERVKLLLSSQDVRCLILLDGLDEYTLPAGYEGLPNMYGIVNAVLLCTTRPWKLVQLSFEISKVERQSSRNFRAVTGQCEQSD